MSNVDTCVASLSQMLQLTESNHQLKNQTSGKERREQEEEGEE